MTLRACNRDCNIQISITVEIGDCGSTHSAAKQSAESSCEASLSVTQEYGQFRSVVPETLRHVDVKLSVMVEISRSQNAGSRVQKTMSIYKLWKPTFTVP